MVTPPLDPDHDQFAGVATGASALIVYGDYTCVHTRRAFALDLRLQELMQDDMVFAYRQLPLGGEHAERAARFALAAAQQGMFWEAHERLFLADPSMSKDGLRIIAGELNCDVDQLFADMSSDAVSRKLSRDQASARVAGVTDTPALFINGARYAGAWDELSIIEEAQQGLGVRVRSAAESFFHWAASAGLVLILATLAALIFVNIGFQDTYEHWRETEFGLSLGAASFSLSIEAWVNDGLMAVFFLLVGIEIKRELVYGELSSLSKAILPLIGALGGIIAPILFYLAFNYGTPTQGGWGIPMATDIAFTLGIMALLGSRVPLALKIFVSALAIADDLGAILVIAIFYGHGFHFDALLWAAAILAIMIVLNRGRIYSRTPYLILGVLLWYFTHESGLHATLAGVLTAAVIPSRDPANVAGVAAQTAAILDRERPEDLSHEAMSSLQNAVDRLREPGYHLQHRLEGWTNFLILPLFAFFNTGIVLSGGAFSPTAPVSLGVILGLVVGKPVGITFACWLAVRFGWASLSPDVRWSQLIGAGCLAGVGFTMSIFIATSAFEGDVLNSVKLSVLIASIASAAIGIAILRKSADTS